MRLGVVVDPRGTSQLWRVPALGATAISIRIRDDPGQRAYLETARGQGLDVLGVLDRASFSDPRDYRGQAEADLDRIAGLVDAELITALAVGHEPDDGFGGGVLPDDPLFAPRGGILSWALAFAELAELIELVHERLDRPEAGHARIPLLLGGLVSGIPDVLDWFDLSRVDGVLVNPYGAGPGTLRELLDAYAERIAARGLSGRCRLGIGELGRSDYTASRGAVADWFSEMLAVCAERDDTDAVWVCCDSDLTLDGYGQFGADERPKPSVSAIYAAASRLPEVLLWGTMRPEDDPEDADEAEDPYLEQEEHRLWASLQADADRGAPETRAALGALLTQYGIDPGSGDHAAMLALIESQTGGRCLPVAEGGSYARCERRYGSSSMAGIKLGNLYCGDGYRFRARGLLPIRGRSAYRMFAELLDLPLLDEPDLALVPTVALAIAVGFFEQHELFRAASCGDHAAIVRSVDPGLNSYQGYLAAVQAYYADADADAAGNPDGWLGVSEETARAAFAQASERLGDRQLGSSDLVVSAYHGVTGADLIASPDALYHASSPIAPDQACPGDLVLYEYGDPSQGGARFKHVGLVSDRPDQVLDARDPLGVGYRPHILGAVRRYRRVMGEPTEDEDAMWQQRYQELAEQVHVAADELEKTHAVMAAREALPDPPNDKAQKPVWVLFGQRLRQHREQVAAFDEIQLGCLQALAFELREMADTSRTPTASPPEPEADPEA